MYNTKHELSTSTAKTKYDQLGREPICLPAEIEDKIERNMGHRVLRNILGNGLYIEWLYASYFISFKEYKLLRPKALDRLNELPHNRRYYASNR